MDATRQRLRTTRFAAVTLLVTSALLLLLVPVPSLAGANPPTVEITLAPPSSTDSRTARFEFASDQESRFRCSRQFPLGPWRPGNHNFTSCGNSNSNDYTRTAATKYTHLWLGSHRLCVKAINVGGEESSPSCHEWQVTAPRPTDFNPELAVTTSTYRAGAHPDLTVQMDRPFNRCAFPDPASASDPCEELYLEQNLKRMVTSFPPGLVTDANAAPFCDPFNEPVFDPTANESGSEIPRWRCRNESAHVGTVAIIAQLCTLAATSPSESGTGCGPNQASDFPLPPGASVAKYGAVYNARPRTSGSHAGEHGHLVVLWPRRPGQGGTVTSPVRTDLSINVRSTDTGIDSVADNQPDLGYDQNDQDWSTAQTVQMKFTIEGETGLASGHPALTNPTFCDRQSIDVEFQGYAQNSWREWISDGFPNPSFLFERDYFIMEPGTGNGKTVQRSVPYQATGCNALPYAPTFTASVSTDAPGAAPEITTVITQKPDEATTKKTVVTLPKGTGLNLNNKLKPCPADALARKDCPESSRVATAEAESRLLPIGETLKGNVYLTGQKGSKLTMSLLLKGFVDLRIDGTSGVENDTINLAFDNQPAMPTSKLTFKFAGDDKSLITNPRKCGSITTTANFTSHSGKSHVVSVPMQVKGCSGPTFDVDLSEPARGKRTAIELVVDSNQKPIKEIKFGLDHRAKVSCKGLGKRRKFGELSVTTEKSGAQEAALKRPKRAPCKKKNKRAFDSPSILGGMKFNLYRKRLTRKKPKIIKHAKNKRALRKKTVPKLRASLKPLPSETTSVTLTLNPSETKFLRNPKSCKVSVLALVKTTDGVKYALKKKLKLRGKGCGKKKKKG